ncbi:MAG: ABC transporter substrate-binding protein [Mobilitalea sp.]
MLKSFCKKFIPILLAVVMVFSLTACKKETNSDGDKTTKGNEEVKGDDDTNTPDSPKEKVKITYWHIFPEGDAFKPVHDKLIKDFNESQDEVYVEDLGISFFDYLSKMDTAIPAGTGPDVGFNALEDNAFRAGAGVLVDLKPYIEADGFDLGQFYKTAQDYVSYEGGVYGLPFAWGNRVLVYNKQMFRDAGLDPEKPPTTLEELEEYAEKLTKLGAKGEIEVMGFHPSMGNATYKDFLYQNGGTFFDENDNPTINSEENLKTLNWYVDMTNKYGAKQVQAFTTTSGSTGIDPFLAGYVAMEVNVDDFYKKLLESDIDFGICPIPLSSEGGVRGTVGSGFTLEIFNHDDEAKAEAAWKFISYMTSVEAQQYWVTQNKWPVGNQVAMETNEEMKDDANWQVIVEELSYARFDKFIPAARAWWGVLVPEIQAAQQALKTPGEALEAAQKSIELQIEDYNAQN